MTDDLAVSVVIAFKDWGVNRLLTSVASIVQAIKPLAGEVIVSDYGSEAGPVIGPRVEAVGARYVYTVTDGTWSRSRGLNAGFAISRGEVLISTDADMLFSPGSLATVAERVLAHPQHAVVLQCRDLPAGYSEHDLSSGAVDWRRLQQVSRIRPRWGMGGMMAVPRGAYVRARGFDERMEIYGGEDMDFADRMRRLGLKLHWIDEPDVRMYHMWHPPTRGEVSKAEAGRDAIAFNRAIVLNDRSVARNLPKWRHALPGTHPLVSVVIATRNRAAYLRDSINSVLAQTFQDFELIVVDDGSTDSTAEAVASFGDPRISYVYQEHAGIAAARNRAASLSNGFYTAVHDDDDLMLPWRLESNLRAIQEGFEGSYGGWVDFDDASGELTPNLGRTFSLGALLYSSRVYAHATLMIETGLLRRLGYNESLRSGSDYNLAVRLARTGASLRHTGEFHIMRRLHDHQVTSLDRVSQGQSARLTVAMVQSHLTPDTIAMLRKEAKALGWEKVRGSDDLRALVGPYLPDHLVERSLFVDVGAGVVGPLRLAGRTTEVRTTSEGAVELVTTYVERVSWDDLATLRAAGLSPRVLRTRGADDDADSPPTALAVTGDVIDRISSESPGYHWVCLEDAPEATLDSWIEGVSVAHSVRWGGQTEGSMALLGFEYLEKAQSYLVGDHGPKASRGAWIMTREDLDDVTFSVPVGEVRPDAD